MDCRNWDQHNTSFLEIAGEVIVPIGDRINSLVAAAPTTTELLRSGKYLILESEVGSHRIRLGKARARTVSAASAANDTLTAANHLYVTGDGPVHVGYPTMVQGNPSLTFQQNPGANDKIIRSTGSWVTDGFAVANVLTIEDTTLNNVSNGRTVAAISTTTNANDTLEFAGDVLQNEVVASGGFVGRGALAAPLSRKTDYWVISVSSGALKLALSRDAAFAGVAVDITGAQIIAKEIGGFNGPYRRVGFTPGTPFENATETGEKLLRQGEQVVIVAGSVTVRSQAANDVLKYWSVG